MTLICDTMRCNDLAFQVHLCRAKVRSRSCMYYNNTDGMSELVTTSGRGDK